MKYKNIIVDTGPIVAFLNKNDKFHNWAISKFSQLEPPLFTSESVISEACFLLNKFSKGSDNLFQLLERGLIKIQFNLNDEFLNINKLITKYRNIPISLADATLVRMSELIQDSAIFTMDNDFKIYRKEKRKVIPIIIP